MPKAKGVRCGKKCPHLLGGWAPVAGAGQLMLGLPPLDCIGGRRTIVPAGSRADTNRPVRVPQFSNVPWAYASRECIPWKCRSHGLDLNHGDDQATYATLRRRLTDSPFPDPRGAGLREDLCFRARYHLWISNTPTQGQTKGLRRETQMGQRKVKREIR